MIGIYELQGIFSSETLLKFIDINCYGFSGKYVMKKITVSSNDYNYFVKVVDSNYNYFTNYTLENNDKILITYLSPCLGGADTGEIAIVLERIKEDGTIEYECNNSLVSDSVILYYPSDYFTYNNFFKGYQINGYLLISNKYPALFDIVVEELDIFGFTFQSKEYHQKLGKLLNEGLIYIYLDDIKLTYKENRSIKYYFHPDTHIKKFYIVINEKTFKKDIVNIGFYINLCVEYDSYELKSLPLFIVKRNPFEFAE